MSIHFLTGTILLIMGFINFSVNDWKLELDKEGIKVYTRSTDISDFKEFKGEMVMDGTVSEIADEISNIEKYPEWSYKTESVRIIKKEGNIVQYFFVSKTPGFLKTRVAYFESKKETDSKTNEVIISLRNIQSDEPISESSLPIPLMKGFWKLTPVEGNKVHVMMQMLMDPGGIIPAWLANMVVVDSPYVTLRNLRERIATDSRTVK